MNAADCTSFFLLPSEISRQINITDYLRKFARPEINLRFRTVRQKRKTIKKTFSSYSYRRINVEFLEKYIPVITRISIFRKDEDKFTFPSKRCICFPGFRYDYSHVTFF